MKNKNNDDDGNVSIVIPPFAIRRIFMSLFELVYMHSNVQYVCLFTLISTIMMAINSEHVYKVMEHSTDSMESDL